MPTYQDLFIRDDLADVGHIPSEAATACYSPDILIWGEEILPNPKVYLTQNWGVTWYKNVVSERENYIYCRAKNLSGGPAAGQLHLYFAIGGMLSDVATWRNNKIPTGIISQDYIKLAATAADEVVVGDAAFEWTPPTGQGNHHCLVAQIVTETNPNPLPASFPDTEAYVRWVLDNPAIAWRNINVIDLSGAPAYRNQIGFQNLEPSPHEYLFVVKCTNVPVDTVVSMVCSVLGPEPVIDVSQEVRRSTGMTLSTTSELPARMIGSVDVRAVLPPGITWPGNAKVTFEYYMIMGGNLSQFMRDRARPISEYDIVLEGRVDEPTAIRLGSYTAQTLTEETALPPD